MQVSTFRLDPEGAALAAAPPWDGPGTLVLVFFAPKTALDPRALQGLRAVYPGSFMLGVSTWGEILGTRLEDGGAAVAVLRFEATGLRLARADVSACEGSREAGECLARQLSDPRLRGVILFTSGLEVNGADVAQGIAGALPSRIPVCGGVAAGGQEVGPTFTLGAAPGEPLDLDPRQVVGVGLLGEAIRITSATCGGWSPFGLERQVTRSRRNTLYELDGKPALALYRTYLGERAEELPLSAYLFPLAILGGEGEPLVRSVLSVDETDQSLIFGAEVQEGLRVQLMHASVDRLVEAAAQAAERLEALGPGEGFCLVVSCMGRRVVLGERAEEELEAVAEALPPGIRMAGYYSNGEISPSRTGECLLHNQTMTLALIREV